VSHVSDPVRYPAVLSLSPFRVSFSLGFCPKLSIFVSFGRPETSDRGIEDDRDVDVDKSIGDRSSLRDSGCRETRSDRLSYIDHVRGKSRGMHSLYVLS